MRPLLIFVCMLGAGFVAAALAVSFSLALSYVRLRRGGAAAVQEDETLPVPPNLLRTEDELSTIRVWASLLARIGHVHTLRKQIEEANLNWSAGRVTLSMLLSGSIAALILSLPSWSPTWFWASGGCIAASAPYLFIRTRRARRFRRFAAQFPEALDTLTRALKAGYPLSAGIELLGMEQPEPVAAEMRRTRDEWKLGHSWDQALDNLANRIPIPEVRMFAAAVKLQNRIGGRLNDVLSRVAEGMRDAEALESEVRAISVHSRMTGLVLTLLPLGIVATMLLVNPGYILSLPQSETGRTLILLAIAANVSAHFIIRHLSRIRI